MTQEELKEHCKKQVESCEMWAKAKGEEPSGKIYEEHKLILELLEQEPCEDAISRQMVKEQMIKYGFHAPDMTVTEFVEDELTLATPQPKTGHWINAYPDIEPNPMFMYGICSVCGFEQSISNKLNYCPNCGAKMIEP